MATLDASIVNIALPTLTKELGPGLNQMKWVVTSYLLVITCLLLPFGRLSDQKGRKFFFQMGYLIFIFGSSLCGVASHLSALVVFRGIQAVGASMLMANGPAIITSVFSTRERGSALGTLAMVVSTGLVVGPSLGGFLITNIGWRSIFWINIPIGFLGLFFASRFQSEDRAKTQIPFDWLGTFLQTLLLLLFITVFDPPRISVSGSLPISFSRWLAIGLLLVFLAIFMKVEGSIRHPLFDLSLLRNRNFWTANLAGFLTFVAFSSVTVLMPFFLEEVLFLAPHTAGLYMTSIPLTIFVVAPLSGRLSDRLGSQGLRILGTSVGCIGLLAMAGVFGAGIHEHSSNSSIILALCSIGFAMGLFQSPNNNVIMGSVPTNKLGVASAVLATIRNLGLVTGTCMSTTLFTWQMAVSQSFVRAFHGTLFVAGMMALGALLVAAGKLKSS